MARTCYDHLAGRLGVGIADALVARNHIELDGDGGTVTEAGHVFLHGFGVTAAPGKHAKRLFCRPCLDWSERRPHLAGTLGTAIACRCFELGWVKKVCGSRAVAITLAGHQGLQQAFGINLGFR